MSDKRLFLKPAEGRAVRREQDGEPWPAEGDWTESTVYVRRRLTDGDLVEASPPKPVKPAGDESK
ncbi:DUF2635 domain-containing protein [Bosea sp. (in: a-proteobacteria)]|uniref:DUF2635 domain-containing protein n=1 Tax=Bosea sp. (in: a-proteobacteria) TaxID=1871050 RepID=UPI001AD22E96|nr:DUF2635 domain-containing protein [Bosea sp. (in: a-proteobacteria)]MBN9438984.1 DUF2635 domain-containing protein [Bosea sp. (in: a-proteobacteria)]